MRLVPIEYIQSGATLSKNLYNSDGKILIRNGVELTVDLLTRLKKMGYRSLYINDKYSDNIVADLIDEKLRLESVKQIKNGFNTFEKYLKTMKKADVKSRDIDLKYRYISEITENSEKIVDDLLNKKELVINVADVKNKNDYVYQHSVSVAILSNMLGIELGLSKKQLMDLTTGALLHDIGYIHIDNSIIEKEGTLTSEERKAMEKHPEIGYDYLKSNLDVSSQARMIVLQHHQCLDGSGYPPIVDPNSITLLSKIVAIVDKYDALTSDRPFRPALTPDIAIEHIFALATTCLDTKLTKIFSKLIIPYPVGTLVELTNKEIGVVSDVDVDYPLRPLVKVVKQNGRKVDIIDRDLMKEHNILIKGVHYTIPKYAL